MLETSSILAWGPALTFLPLAIHSCCKSAQQEASEGLHFVLLALATFLSVLWFYIILDHHWEQSFSSTIFATIAGSSLIYIVFSRMYFAAKRLVSLFSIYMLYLSILAAISHYAPVETEVSEADIDSWLILHIVIAILTYALLTLAAIAALAVVIKETVLKKKMKSVLADNLPSVFDANHLQFNFMLYAEILLGVGLLTGFSINVVNDQSLIDLDHKTTFSILAFIAIAFLLVLHRKLGIRGKRAAHWVLLAYLLVTLGYPGVKFVTNILI